MKAVFFDMGETLVDETRAWSGEAERAGVSTLVFFAALGALIERGADHREVWGLVGVEPPSGGMDVDDADLYPDARPTLEALAAAGYRLGIAGNQPESASRALTRLALPVDVVSSSAELGASKPSPAFFERLACAAGLPPAEIVYVGDRLDNDVLPAQAVGMFAVFVRRGPWGYLHAQRPEVAQADARVDSLLELPALLGPSG